MQVSLICEAIQRALRVLVLRGAEHHSDNIKGTKIKYRGSVNVNVYECECV